MTQGDAPEEGDAPADTADTDGFAGKSQQEGGKQEGGVAMDQSRFANLASASASTHSAQSDAAELGLSTPSQQEARTPESISPDNLYGNEDDDANLRAMDNEDLGLTSPAKSEVHKAALQFGAKASMLMQKRPTRAPATRAPVALAAAADDEVNTQESGASMAPNDEFATKGHFMLIPGTSCQSLSPTVTDAFCLSSCASGKAG